MYQEFWDLDMCNFYEYSPTLQSTAQNENTYNSKFEQPAHSRYNGCYNEMSSCMYSQTSSLDENNSYGCTAQDTISSGSNSVEENSLDAPNMMQIQQYTNVQETADVLPNNSLMTFLDVLGQQGCHIPDSTTKDLQIAHISKRKRTRTAFTTEQIRMLERQFQKRPYVSRDERQVLHQKLCVSDQVIKVWFQNRRLKEKKIQEEKLAEVQEATAPVNIFQGFGISLDLADAIPSITEVTPAKFSDNMKYHEPISPPDFNEDLVEISSSFQPVDPGISLQSLL